MLLSKPVARTSFIKAYIKVTNHQDITFFLLKSSKSKPKCSSVSLVQM